MNNEEKNSYVIKQITFATLDLLKQYELSEISISQITNKAMVSRNSFYRNFTTKEEILLFHIRRLIGDWRNEYDKQQKNEITDFWGAFFGHLKENSDFYLLLKERGLFSLCLDVLLEMSGPKPEYDNIAAYLSNFVIYGLFGWMEEWLKRGMQESAETMTEALALYGFKQQ